MNRLLFAAALLFCSPLANATEIGTSKTTGLGVSGGILAGGLSAKFYRENNMAVQVTVGSYGYSNLGGTLLVGSDLTTNFTTLFQDAAGQLLVNAGAGGALVMYNVAGISGGSLGANGVLGLVWQFADLPLEMTIDWRPTILIGDYYSGLYLYGNGLGIRYFF